MCQLGEILGHFLRRLQSYPMYIHLFNAQEVIVLFHCICYFLAEPLLAGPKLTVNIALQHTFNFSA